MRQRGKQGLAEQIVTGNHGNPFDMQLPYRLSILELSESFIMCSSLIMHLHKHNFMVFTVYEYICMHTYFKILVMLYPELLFPFFGKTKGFRAYH